MACVNVTSQGAREKSHSHLPVDVHLVLFVKYASAAALQRV
jgi:hypothetical protein